MPMYKSTGLRARLSTLWNSTVLRARDFPSWLKRGPSIPWGLEVWEGEQGTGKTSGMAARLQEVYDLYGPQRILFCSNFAWTPTQTGHPVTSVTCADDLLDLVLTMKKRQDYRAVCAGVDEMVSWYDSYRYREVTTEQRLVIVQQRKRRVNILGTVQEFGMIAKPIRTHVKYVWIPRLFNGRRLIRVERYKGKTYRKWWEKTGGMVDLDKLHPGLTCWYTFTDELRESFDTFATVEDAVGRSVDKRKQDAEDLATAVAAGVAEGLSSRRPPLSPAEKQRAYRQRKRAGVTVT